MIDYNTGSAQLDAKLRRLELAEINMLLHHRTRDIALPEGLLERFLKRSWPARAAVLRTWLLWTAIFSLCSIGLHLQNEAVPPLFTIAVAGLLQPAGNLLLCLLWRKPRSESIQGASIFAWILFVLVSMNGFAYFAGGEAFEKFSFVGSMAALVTIAIVSLNRTFLVISGAAIVMLHAVAQIFNPTELDTGDFAVSAFLVLATAAIAINREAAAAAERRSFLFTERDRVRSDIHAALATTDPLTDLTNRRAIDAWTERLFSGDTSVEIAVLMCDIDHFKALNDRFGHDEGDRCLCQAAKAMEEAVWSKGEIARYGGEEFLVVARDVSSEEALDLAEKIRAAVERLGIPHCGSSFGRLTLSVGVATASTGETTFAELRRRADRALYSAKAAGRNRIMLAPDRDATTAEDAAAASPAVVLKPATAEDSTWAAAECRGAA